MVLGGLSFSAYFICHCNHKSVPQNRTGQCVAWGLCGLWTSPLWLSYLSRLPVGSDALRDSWISQIPHMGGRIANTVGVACSGHVFESQQNPKPLLQEGGGAHGRQSSFPVILLGLLFQSPKVWCAVQKTGWLLPLEQTLASGSFHADLVDSFHGSAPFIDCVRLLLAAEAQVDAADKNGFTPLCSAVAQGHVK